NIPHNDVSITQFIKTQIENIVMILPEFKLIIIGKNPSLELIELSKKYDRYIEIKGYVETLDDVFNGACGMIIPLMFGSGVKLKTLEAMAKGLPVIATDFGVEGIPVTKGVNCLVENNFDNYPDVLSKLCDVQLNEKISKEAIKFYNNYYAKDVVFRHYEDIFMIND
ncbi:glycosyltransferase family 4 protein, partial [Neobacillus drentensis]|uniref:glycosyltransferase family 4 protein n=1 Tax=Neobacillus drentensis TaxID=220684 RepID=UPI00300182F6